MGWIRFFKPPSPCGRRTLTGLRVAATLLALALEPLFPLEPGVAPEDYLHTSWTQNEGIDLPAVFTLAQTLDGYLWLGTSDGLIRFDGMRFVRWQSITGEKLPDSRIRFLRPSKEAGLWVGTDSGVYRLDRGHIQTYSSANKWVAGRVTGMVEDHLARLWIIGSGPKAEMAVVSQDGSMRIYGPGDGLPDRKPRSVFIDAQRNLWVATDRDLCRWLPGKPADCSSAPELNSITMVENAANLLLASTRLTRDLKFSGRHAEDEQSISSLPARVMLRDVDGNSWIGTIGQGLWRLTNGRLQSYTRREGLSSDVINSVIEDREGNLWVGTAKGIDRFRDPKVFQLSTFDGLSSDLVTAVLPAGDGSAWVGTMAGLNHVTGEQITRYLADSGLPGTAVSSLVLDKEKRLWAGTNGGLAYLKDKRFAEVRTADGMKPIRVLSMIPSPDGGVWAADERSGLFAVQRGVARPLTIPGLVTRDIFQMFRDRDGIVWFGHFGGGVSTFDGSALKNFGAPDGLAEGSVQAIMQDRSGIIWIGTRNGLSRFRNGHWTTWDQSCGIPTEGVRGIIEDDYGALWMITAQGLLRTPLDALNRTPDGSPGKLSQILYSSNDGLKPMRNATMANPRGGKSGDGRIWIGTEDGVAVIDPARIRSNPVPPPVVVEQILVDGKPMDLNSPSAIRFKGELVQITYTGLSLMVPERVNFKYLLEGHDREWTEAGAGRNTTYVNLRPGWYRFRVIAANNDGLWNNLGASVAFHVDPHFYQTKWFIAVCIAVPLLIGAGAHRLRVRRLALRFQLIAQERARLTRELHDSLLQGFAAVVYQLEAAARQFESAPATSKQRLNRALEQADQSLQEARSAMQSMRLSALENSTLPDALSAIATRLTEGTSVHFRLEVKGRVRHPSYEAQAGVYMIGREAIANAVNHAHATRIHAGLTYSDRELRLVVQDDGKGFDPDTAMNKSGHWGMSGMRERAAQLGADFTIDSSPGHGTKIEVVVPQK